MGAATKTETDPADQGKGRRSGRIRSVKVVTYGQGYNRGIHTTILGKFVQMKLFIIGGGSLPVYPGNHNIQ